MDRLTLMLERDELDRLTMNKLSVSPDLKEFLNRVKEDVESKEVRTARYERVESKDTLVEFFKNKKS